MCLTFTYLGFYTAKRAWNKDSWHRQPAKTLDTNLFWLWPERHQCWHDHLRSCVHAGCGHFERMLWPECSFIWFTKTFCQCNLMHVMAKLKLCSHAFSVFRLSQGSVATIIRWGGWRLYIHVSFISKFNSEKYIEIRLFLTKLQTKISWLLYLSHNFNVNTRMWANAHRDGRPAEHRCALFSTPQFGWRPLLDCCAVTLPRRDTHWTMMGCPKPDLSR